VSTYSIDGSYTGSGTLSYLDFSGVLTSAFGDYLGLAVPSPILPTRYGLTASLDAAAGCPARLLYLASSDEGVSWVLLDSRTDLAWGVSRTQTFTVPLAMRTMSQRHRLFSRFAVLCLQTCGASAFVPSEILVYGTDVITPKVCPLDSALTCLSPTQDGGFCVGGRLQGTLGLASSSDSYTSPATGATSSGVTVTDGTSRTEAFVGSFSGSGYFRWASRLAMDNLTSSAGVGRLTSVSAFATTGVCVTGVVGADTSQTPVNARLMDASGSVASALPILTIRAGGASSFAARFV
jgi:hypothetical protein